MTLHSSAPPTGTADVPDPMTSACPSAEILRQYLSGWTDEDQSERLELHLQLCEMCERTLQELEVQPDTLMQALQSTVAVGTDAPSAAAELKSCDPDSCDPINGALDKARQLMDRPIESAADRMGVTWEPAGRELGIYELQRTLGRGGMGAVYLATHRQLRKQVAIKLLPLMSAEDSDVRARFEREIRVIGRLNHPSIVTATDAGEIDGTQFLVMEYVSGMDLSRLARLLGRLPVPEACELMRQVALGLSCAHAEGVVHRDIKPSNLMLHETGHIIILDFGLAQFCPWDEASVDLTTVGQLMGTLDYMAPEQAEQSGAVDYRADLYALGATLFRLLCGRPPLAAAPNQSPLEKLRLLATQPAPRLSTLCPEAPPELVSLLASLLARHPQDRPASAAHVAEQLAAFTTSEDLPLLLKRGTEKEALSPELRQQPELARDIVQLKRPAVRAATAGGEGNHGNRRRLWLAAATLPLLICAGIFIKLELSKGQLIIESQVDNVTVQIVQGDKAVEGLSISHGTTATRLRADTYQITIDGPSDELLIENGVFTLKNGETVIARIRRVEQMAAPAHAADAPDSGSIPDYAPIPGSAEPVAARATPQPLYEGRSIDEWLETLARERSPSELKRSLDACSALVTPETASQITTVLLRLLPQLDGEMRLVPDSESRTTLDQAAATVLDKANRGAEFFKMWTREFEAGDENWRTRLWKNYSNPIHGQSSDSERLEPFIVWAERRLRAPATGNKANDDHTVKAAEYIRGYAGDYGRLASNAEFVNRVSDILKSSPQLGMIWWLSQPLVYRSTSDRQQTETNLWPPPIKSEITRIAIEALTGTDTNPALVAQACSILAHGAELNPEQQAVVLNAISRRLIVASSSPELLTEVVKTDQAFAPFIGAQIQPNGPLIASSFRVVEVNSRRGGVSKHCVVLEMLNVVSKLEGNASLRPQLDLVLYELQGTMEKIVIARAKQRANVQTARNSRARLPFDGRFPALLSWPDFLDSPNAVTAASIDELTLRAKAAIWGDHLPTAQDWLRYLILLHPAMHESVVAKLTELEAENAETNADVPAPSDIPTPANPAEPEK